jgi:tetratricopeptide (TPR) repeat protein
VSGFVVCTACGTRIKAGRSHCLRCFEPLPDPDVPVRPSNWQSLGLSTTARMLVGVVSLAVALALVGIIWSTWPQSPVDSDARPSAAPGTRAAPASPPAPTADPADTPPVDAAALDAPPVAGAKPAPLTAADRSDLEALRAKYEQVLAKTPDDPDTLNRLGQVLMRLERPSEALAPLSRAVALGPDVPRNHVNLARAATAAGNAGQAIEEYREAVRLLPTDFAIRYTLALALQKHGEHEAALPEFERTIQLAPSDATPHVSYAESLEQLQRTSDAIREYRRYLEMRPAARDAGDIRARLERLAPARP